MATPASNKWPMFICVGDGMADRVNIYFFKYLSLVLIILFFGCEDAAQQVQMYVCLSEFQVEILPSYSFQRNSEQFQNVPECSQAQGYPW